MTLAIMQAAAVMRVDNMMKTNATTGDSTAADPEGKRVLVEMMRKEVAPWAYMGIHSVLLKELGQRKVWRI